MLTERAPWFTMSLPVLQKCCGCLPLEKGCFLLCILSTSCCFANIAAGSWKLPQHASRRPEDNLISMSMVMFSSLSAISDFGVMLGMCLVRPAYIQLSMLCNSIFTLCIFLVAVVTCLFSPELAPFLEAPGNIALVVVLIFLGAAYSFYYFIVVNSMFRKMKMTYSDSAIPV